jgi:hypothetical protein
LACAVANPDAIDLLAMDPDTLLSSPFKERFEAARSLDECLTEVTRLSEVGNATNMLIGPLSAGRSKGSPD